MSFRKINGFEGETLSNNFRNDQPVGFREVFFRSIEEEQTSSVVLFGQQLLHFVGISGALAVLAITFLAGFSLLIAFYMSIPPNFSSNELANKNQPTKQGIRRLEELILLENIDKLYAKYS